MKRETYRLSSMERHLFEKLCQSWRENAADLFRFWGTVARSRGLDPASLLGVPFQPDAFTALPIGHGKHWCWPSPLKCAKPPPEFVTDDEGRSRPAAEFRENRGGVSPRGKPGGDLRFRGHDLQPLRG